MIYREHLKQRMLFNKIVQMWRDHYKKNPFYLPTKSGAIKKKSLDRVKSTQVGHKNKCQILCLQWKPLIHTKNYYNNNNNKLTSRMGTQSRCNEKLSDKIILSLEWGHKVDAS